MVRHLRQIRRSAYRKQRISACGSREFCATQIKFLRVSREFGLVRVRTPASAEIQRLPCKQRMVIAGFSGKQSLMKLGPDLAWQMAWAQIPP